MYCGMYVVRDPQSSDHHHLIREKILGILLPFHLEREFGTKVKSISLLDDPVNGHDISCKIDGFGCIYLKCSVVWKDS